MIKRERIRVLGLGVYVKVYAPWAWVFGARKSPSCCRETSLGVLHCIYAWNGRSDIRVMVGLRSVYVDIHTWGKLGDIRDGSIRL